MRTFVYVDGFNLYYGALKGTPWKWLDLVALIEKVLQAHHDILTVRYFTARVSGTPTDQSKPQRQDVYLRALRRYRPEVEVYFGHFLSHRVRAPLAQPTGNQRTAEVIKTEEKGSDVNLAVHLLNDGWLDGVPGVLRRARKGRHCQDPRLGGPDGHICTLGDQGLLDGCRDKWNKGGYLLCVPAGDASIGPVRPSRHAEEDGAIVAVLPESIPR